MRSSDKSWWATNWWPTLVFCHANAGNMGLRMPNFKFLTENCKVNVLWFDYRGYGNSGDVPPTEDGLILDGLAWMNYLKQQRGCRGCYLFGRSLGGAVAIALAEAHAGFGEENRGKYPRLEGIILENTFTSISQLVDKLFPWMSPFQPIKNYFLRIKWDSLWR